jgi:carbonic anhydrase
LKQHAIKLRAPVKYTIVCPHTRICAVQIHEESQELQLEAVRALNNSPDNTSTIKISRKEKNPQRKKKKTILCSTIIGGVIAQSMIIEGNLEALEVNRPASP